MKKYLTTIITVCVLLVAIAGLIVMLSLKNKNTDNNPTTTEEPENESSYLYVFSDADGKMKYSQDNVVKAETSYAGVNYVLECKDGTWCCTNHDFKTYATTISETITSFTTVLGQRIDDVENIQEYGFGEDLSANPSVKLTMDDGTEMTVYVGDIDFTQSYRYVYNPAAPTRIYKVSVYTATNSLLIQKEDLIKLKAFTYSSSDTPIYLIIKQKGEQVLKLTFKEAVKSGESDDDVTWTWHVTYPVDRDSSNTQINNILETMQGMALSSLSDEAVPVEKLSEYGLDVPSVEYYLYMKAEDGTKTLYSIKVGNFTEDETEYYCLVEEPENGLCDIFKVQIGYISKSIKAIDFIDSSLYIKSSDYLDKIEFTLGGESHTMTFKHTKASDGETEDITEYYDGIECIADDNYTIVASGSKLTPPTEDDLAKNRDADITNDVITVNPYDCFNRLLTSFYLLSLKEAQVEVPDKAELGALIFTVTYTETDGTTTKLDLYERDETTAYAYLNDTFAGGYVRTYALYGDDYEAYDVTASLKGLKAVLALLP